MSIANLNDIDITIDDLKVKNIDTPTAADSLTIGTVNAQAITMGVVGRAVNVKGRLRTNIIDVDTSVGNTLFIGPDDAVDIAIGGPVGNPVTIPRGILANSVNRGGSAGVGQLEIGVNAATTSLVIGNNAAPINMQASTLFFPSSGIPFSINESFVSYTASIAFTGALVNPAGCRVSAYRFGDWVYVTVRHLLNAPLPALNSVDPIIMAGALGIGYRPLSQYTFIVMCHDSGTDTGQANIFPNGNITVGRLNTNHFSAGNDCNIWDFHFAFNVNV